MYLIANDTSNYFTPLPNGITGCLGIYVKSNKTVNQKIHNMFYNQLFEIQINLNAYLETSLTKLIDTVHSLSSDNYVAPLQEPEFDLISQILTLVPDYLLNHKSTIVTYINFEKFFKETITISQESIIKGLSLRNMLEKLSVRSQQIILGSLLQFPTEISQRLGNFISRLEGITNSDVPNSLLYRPDQSPITFIYFMRSLIPELDENLLVESFIIVQNSKTALLQDIAAVLQLPVLLPLISYSDFTKSINLNGKYQRFPENLTMKVTMKAKTRQKRS